MTYQKEQIIHSLSFISNAAFGLEFSKKEYLDNFVNEIMVTNVVTNKTFSPYIGDWELVWGPCVYSHDATSSFARADNTMAIYYSTTLKLFVVAIAGTNTVSSFGWAVEDFNVTEVVAWDSITGTGQGNIAKGTADGLNILLTLEDANTKINCVKALGDFIKNKGIEEAEVAVTGHSLGGALSPALALYLFNKKSTWDNGKQIRVSAYPTAGPTIGTAPLSKSKPNFVKYYESLIGTGVDQIDYQSRVNSKDIVPRAWQGSDLETIPTLYNYNDPTKQEITPVGTPEIVIGTLTAGAALKRIYKQKKFPYILTRKYQQIAPTIELSGTFNTSIDDKVTQVFTGAPLYVPSKLLAYIPYLRNTARFLAQAAFQHTTAYNTLLNIDGLMTGSYHDTRTNVIDTYKTDGKIVKQFSYVQQAVQNGTGVDIDVEVTPEVEES